MTRRFLPAFAAALLCAHAARAEPNIVLTAAEAQQIIQTLAQRDPVIALLLRKQLEAAAPAPLPEPTAAPAKPPKQR